MTGDGTVNNPLIPTTWDEFVTAVETDNVYVELPESGGVFNMNTISPLGISKINFRCREVQGNNWIIAYPFIRGTSWLKARNHTKVYRLHFVNMYAFDIGDTAIIESTAGFDLRFYYCSFSGILLNAGLTTYSYFYNCSINVEVYNNNNNNAFIGLYSYFYDTRINVVGFLKASGSSIRFYLYYCERCEITSKLGNKEVGIKAAISVNSGCIANKFNFSGITRISVSNNPVSNVINSDLNPDLDISSATGFTACTTEQINNAEYLRSIGFPIGVN